MTVRIITGDCRDVLKTLPDESVHCVVTSPPYWGLRDYGVENGIGLEATLIEHIDNLVGVFREVRRVLRSDGTLWLNYGDAYCSTDKWGGGGVTGKQTVDDAGNVPSWAVRKRKAHQPGIKPKDLFGLPWRLAFALQADGWWLRQDIIWSKPNPMPESVTDRCTKAHEYLFLMSKSERYQFDAEAIRERAADSSIERWAQDVGAQEGSSRAHAGGKTNGKMKAVGGPRIGAKGNANTFRGGSYVEGEPGPRTVSGNTKPIKMDESSDRRKVGFNQRWDAQEEATASRNKRSVWTVGTAPFKDAHFATFPPALIEPCILAGCPRGGVVLDPFGGAGTTGLVADRLGRDAILIELNPAYAEMGRARIGADAPLLAKVAAE